MLDDSQLKLLAFTSEVYEYADQDFLFHQDQISDSIFVVLNGEVEIMDVSSGMEVHLATKGSKELIGELAVLRGERRSASVKALGKVDVLKISNERFLDLITKHPEMALFVLKDISSKLAHANELLVAAQSALEAGAAAPT